MSKKRRFYQYDGEDLFIEDMGNTLAISGILLEGMNGMQLLAISPAGTMPPPRTLANSADGSISVVIRSIQPSLEEWSALIRQTDDPVYFADDETGMAKVLHRKQRRAVSGAIQQQIWVRDNLQCVFCLRKMGDAGVSLTVDHFIPLELDGINDQTNCLTLCRRCNKDKGNQDPEKYCIRIGVNYHDIKSYLTNSLTLDEIGYWDTPHSIRKKK